MLDNAERAGIEEQYVSAGSSSSLRVEADKPGDADILIASGLSRATVGGAIMRLLTEYGGLPRNATETDHRLMMMALKTMSVVLDQITLRASQMNIERPGKVALAVIAHYLDKVCRSCDGQKYQRVKDTPSLSVKPCKSCLGVGEIALPYGEAGRRVEEYMLECVQTWRSRTARLLHGRRQ